MTHYVIEHPIRGLLVDFDGENPYSDPRFSWKIMRYDEKAIRFGSREVATRYIGKLPPRIAVKCYVVAISNRTATVLTGDES